MADELEEVMAEGAWGEVVQWEDIAVELDAVPCEWELGSRSVSGCRVRVGVAERGGVLERLWRGVPPIGEGKA